MERTSSQTPGTAGYEAATDRFIEATLAINFRKLHKNFLPFLPRNAGRVLDAGAGIGRDAAVLAAMGHTVTAVEPAAGLRNAGKTLYAGAGIEWIDDALPGLVALSDHHRFDFLLVSGVWHHLKPEEQDKALQRMAVLLQPEGILALTLRNGPAGVGTHVFPTSAARTLNVANSCGLTPRLLLEQQPSLMPGKEQVSWTKIVLQKTAG